jgi:transcriptional regulator with XRE-family HTH domain
MAEERPRRRPPKDPLDHNPAAVTEAREAAKLTKAYVAERLGVSAGLVGEIEKGTRNATPERIEQLAEIFGIPADRLRLRPGQPPARLAAVCVQCSELWTPEHQCPSNRAAKDAA